MRLPRAFLVLSLFLLACGTPAPSQDAGSGGGSGEGDAGGGGTGGGNVFDAGNPDAGFGPVAVSAYCDSKAWAFCDRLRRCGALSSAETFDLCVQDERGKCDQTAYSAGVAAGRTRYSAQQAADCLNGYAKGSCALTPTACDDIFIGQQPADAGCLVPEDCAAGTYCHDRAYTCPFLCRAFQSVGGVCNFSDKECNESEAWCRYDGASGQYLCTARKAAYESCSPNNYGECPVGTVCARPSGETNGTCTPTYAAIGETCRETGGYPLCDGDAFCRQEGDPSQPLPPGTCTRRVGLGGTCTGYGVCQQGLRCSGTYTTGTCLRAGQQGDICNGYGECETGLYCATGTSRCARYPGDGGDCSTTYACDRGLYCDYATDVCLPKRADGARCGDNYSSCASECTYQQLPDAGYDSLCSKPCSVRTDGGV